ncbi:hypothetical protein GJ496_003858 [Pomphorhynchus laevis]|nr:hypothetical protein GJ496_003858 [Pomphorhynchus laevis]
MTTNYDQINPDAWRAQSVQRTKAPPKVRSDMSSSLLYTLITILALFMILVAILVGFGISWANTAILPSSNKTTLTPVSSTITTRHASITATANPTTSQITTMTMLTQSPATTTSTQSTATLTATSTATPNMATSTATPTATPNMATSTASTPTTITTTVTTSTTPSPPSASRDNLYAVYKLSLRCSIHCEPRLADKVGLSNLASWILNMNRKVGSLIVSLYKRPTSSDIRDSQCIEQRMDRLYTAYKLSPVRISVCQANVYVPDPKKIRAQPVYEILSVDENSAEYGIPAAANLDITALHQQSNQIYHRISRRLYNQQHSLDLKMNFRKKARTVQ